MIDGATRIYAIIGDPIRQARSPVIFNPMIQAAGRNALLVPWHAKPDAFQSAMRGLMATSNVDGIVVTFPYKQEALALSDVVKTRAEQVGATNALRRDEAGRWVADMFDGVGLVRAVEGAGRAIAGGKAWVVGAGGAGSAIAYALAAAGASAVWVSDLETPKAEDLASGVMRHHPMTAVRAGVPRFDEITLLVNATTVGLGEDDRMPIDVAGLRAQTTVVDIVPRAGGTPLLAEAQKLGCATIAASAMVEGQAGALLDFFWNG